MTPTWNVHEIAAMPKEARMRNHARRLDQEIREWGRSFAYAGGPVRCYADNAYGGSKRVSLLQGGYKARSWVQVCIDKQPVSRRILAWGNAEQIYMEIAAAEDQVATVEV